MELQRGYARAPCPSLNPLSELAPMPAPVHVVLVMGVSGSGKTTLGTALAWRLASRTGSPWTFADADDFHAPEALEKMGRGESLTDADRAPWLARLAARIQEHLSGGVRLVLACSALRAAYRETLTGGDARVAVLWLDAPADVLARRLEARLGAGRSPVGPSLLPSQFATLEAPAGAARLDATQPVEALVDAASALVLGG